MASYAVIYRSALGLKTEWIESHRMGRVVRYARKTYGGNLVSVVLGPHLADGLTIQEAVDLFGWPKEKVERHMRDGSIKWESHPVSGRVRLFPGNLEALLPKAKPIPHAKRKRKTVFAKPVKQPKVRELSEVKPKPEPKPMVEQTEPPDQLLTVTQVSQLLGIAGNQVANLIAAERLHSVGRHLLPVERRVWASQAKLYRERFLKS